LIDENNSQVGVVEKSAALNMAEEAGLDLVEVSPNSSPPVCRIMDYGKWLYEQKRKLKKSHQHTSTLKEIRLKPETDKHDLDIKVRHAREFLEKGDRVQFTMIFKGRQLLHIEQGYKTFDGIVADLEGVAKIDRPSHVANRRMTLLLVPKK
jgi:translation initiation factor IF-3